MKIKLMFAILILGNYSVTHCLSNPIAFAKKMWHCRPTNPAKDCTSQDQKQAKVFWGTAITTTAAAALAAIGVSAYAIEQEQKNAPYREFMSEFKKYIPFYEDMEISKKILGLQDAIAFWQRSVRDLSITLQNKKYEFENSNDPNRRVLLAIEIQNIESDLNKVNQLINHLQQLLAQEEFLQMKSH